MNALIYDIKRFAIHDGPGIRTTIFFKGCPMDCWWCHNPESKCLTIEHTKKINELGGMSFEVDVRTGEEMNAEKLMREILKEKVFMDESDGGVTLSGGEPLLQSEFVIDLLKILKKNNIHTALDTSGYASEQTFKRLAVNVDLFLFDLKLMDEKKHRVYTRVSNKPILKNVQFLHENKIPVIIRFPFIPGINDGDNLLEMRDFLLSKCPDFKEIHILPYHNIFSHKYLQFGIEDKMKGYSEAGVDQINKCKDFFHENGFSVKIGG